MKDELTLDQILQYEIFSSWWTPYCHFDWMNNLASVYYAKKAERKFNRYKKATQLK